METTTTTTPYATLAEFRELQRRQVRAYVLTLLRMKHGRVADVARVLQVSRSGVYKLIEEHGIARTDYTA